MAFLDNSGDIILDAGLTDTGRYRLAKGDGSFKITKFALGDDEINYASYDKNDPSGSAYYDLEILQTPILEAFTNNTSTMKSKLVSIARTNLLYMPVIIANTAASNTKQSGSVYCVAVDAATVGRDTATPATNVGFLEDGQVTGADTALILGILNGVAPSTAVGSLDHRIRTDQGLNTNQIPKTQTIDAELNETQYIIEMDNRLGSVVSPGQGAGPAKISFIDDDNIASYYLSLATDADYITSIPAPSQGNPNPSTLLGPAGTTLAFKIMASTELQTSTYLFEKLGSRGLNMVNIVGTQVEVRYIDSIVKITGATTGYSIDIPVRYIKKVNQG